MLNKKRSGIYSRKITKENTSCCAILASIYKPRYSLPKGETLFSCDQYSNPYATKATKIQIKLLKY